MKFFEVLFEWDRPITPGERIHYRIFEGLVVLITILNVWSWGFYISNLTEVFLPLGVANHVSLTPILGTNFMLLNAAVITVFLMAAVFRKWSYAYLIVIILFHFQYAARFSQGEISHGSNLAGIILLSFSVSHIFFRNEDQMIRTSLGICYFFAGIGYLSAGVCKLIGTGILWPDGIHLMSFMEQRAIDVYSNFGNQQYNWLQQWAMDSRGIGTLILLFGLLVELSGFLYWFRKTRWIQNTLFLAMHIGIAYTMNIFFGDYFYQLIVLGFPWYILIDKYYFKQPEIASVS